MYLNMKPIPENNKRLRHILAQLGKEFVRRCSPKNILANPILVMMFVGAALSTIAILVRLTPPTEFNERIVVMLWFNLFIAILGESFVRTQSKVQDEIGDKNLSIVKVRKLDNGVEHLVSPRSLRENDLVLCEIGEIIPADGIVVQGTAIVDESAITGQSPPVVRESDGDQNIVCANTTVLGGRIVVRITATNERTLHDRMVSSIDEIKYRPTEDEKVMAVPLWSLVVGLSMLVISLPFFAVYGSGARNGLSVVWLNLPTMIGLWICVFPLAAAELMNIAGLTAAGRLLRKKIVPSHIGAVESAGQIDVLMLNEREVLNFDKQLTKWNVLSLGNMNGDVSDADDASNSIATFPSNKFRGMGIKTVMSSEAGQSSAAAVAAEAGIDDYIVCSVPEDKAARIHSEQNAGHVVAVLGDRNADGHAMAHANIGFIVAGVLQKPIEGLQTMELNGRPSRLVEVIDTGRRLIRAQKMLMRFGIGATISLSLIALFPIIAASYGTGEASGFLHTLNFLAVTSPQASIFGIFIFNGFILVLFTFLAFRFVDTYRSGTHTLSNFNITISGLVGFIMPLMSVKLIDVLTIIFRSL